MITELLLALALSGPSLPQDTATRPPAGEPAKVGVVLSGGSAKGFAHVGVLRVLEEAGIRIQAITGTSMGGLIGGLYALGYTPEQLEQLTLSQDWGALFSDAVRRRDVPALRKLREDQTLFTLPLRNGLPQLPAGLVRGQRITQLITRLTWNAHEVRDFSRLPIPFVAVATDIETGDAVPLKEGFLPEAIRASIGFPGAFYPVRVDGRLLVDGVLARNLPAQDAKELGATFLICSDVSAPLITADSIRTLVDVLNQAISFRAEESNRKQRELCDILIRPNIEGISSLAFDRAAEWIKRGEEAAREVWPAIREVGETAGAGPRQRLSDTPDSVLVTALSVEGTQRASRAMVRRALGIEVPGWLTPEAIGTAMDRVYATGLFGSVSYRLESGPDGSTRTLVIEVDEESLDRVGFAFRYESQYRASLLTTVEFSDFLSYGTTLKFRLRLGNQIQFAAQLLRIAELLPRLNLSGGLEFNSTPLDIFEGDTRVGAADISVWNLSVFTGIGLGNEALLGFRWKGEYANTEPNVGVEGFDSEELFHTVAATVNIDTRPRTLFPDRGVHIIGKSELASRAIGSSRNFSHHVVEADIRLPLLDFLSLGVGGFVGTSTGGGLPPHYLFFAGGANTYAVFPQRQIPFLGLSVQELAGRHAQVVRADLTVETLANVFVGLAWNAGEAMDEWRFEPERYVHGGAVSLGVLSPFGMARMTASKAERAEPRFEIDLGYPF